VNISSTAQTVLDIAQNMVQTRGYNGFSFRDIAKEIGIKSASIHYHFPTKADLAHAVASRYRERFSEKVSEIGAQAISATQALQMYANLFRTTLIEDKRLCLCAMLASEAESLPEKVRAEANLFFQEQEELLAGIIGKGIEAGEFQTGLVPLVVSKMLLATFEGAMIIARSTGCLEDFSDVADQTIAMLASARLDFRRDLA